RYSSQSHLGAYDTCLYHSHVHYITFLLFVLSFFFHATATTEIYTLSLHDALPISTRRAAMARSRSRCRARCRMPVCRPRSAMMRDRKSTRLNSSHLGISYAVFCLKKKKKYKRELHRRTVGIRRDMRTGRLVLLRQC